ncbi:MAG: flagellar export chaperone FliS [Calditrichaeota bacterium]|nr:flagellar export chaperone FliS [Calditrichota bacterium]
MASFNPYRAYIDVSYQTADQGALILTSYDAALRFCRAGQECIVKGDKVGKGKWLTKAFDLVGELRRSLRPEGGGEISQALSEAYGFIEGRITRANITSDSSALADAISLLEGMRETWREIVRQNRRQPTAGVGLA